MKIKKNQDPTKVVNSNMFDCSKPLVPLSVICLLPSCSIWKLNSVQDETKPYRIGASCQWTTYEAEIGHTNGSVHGPLALRNVTLRSISVEGAGQHIIHIKPGARGSLSISGIDMSPIMKTPYRNDCPDKFTLLCKPGSDP